MKTRVAAILLLSSPAWILATLIGCSGETDSDSEASIADSTQVADTRLDENSRPDYNKPVGFEISEHVIAQSNEVLEEKPDDPEAYKNRGYAYALKGEHDKALADFNKAIELDPRMAEAYNNRGLTYYRMNMLDLALADFNKALELSPEMLPGTYFVKGLLCDRLGRRKEAVEAYRTFVELNPPQHAADVERAEQRLEELEGR